MPTAQRRRALIERAITAIENDDKPTALDALRKALVLLLSKKSRPNVLKAYARERMKCPRCGREVARCVDGSPHAHHRIDDGKACVVARGS